MTRPRRTTPLYPDVGKGNLGKTRAKSKRIDEHLGKKSLTEKQAKILKFILFYKEKVGFPPSMREIGDYFNISGKAAHDHLNAIAKKDYIRFFSGIARGIEILKNPFENNDHSGLLNTKEMVHVPLLGRIAAGLPILAEENIEEELALPKTFISASGEYFALRVSGESMIHAGILDQDIAILRKVTDFHTEIKNGDIVAALIDSQATLKTFFQKDGQIELCPSNPDFKKIKLQEQDRPMIIGKLIGIYRKY